MNDKNTEALMVTIPFSEYRELVNFKLLHSERKIDNVGKYPKTVTTPEVLEWLKMYDIGESVLQIGMHFGRSASLVRYVIFGKKVSKRVRSELEEMASRGEILWPREMLR